MSSAIAPRRPLVPAVRDVTARIVERSRTLRTAYLARMRAPRPATARAGLPCSNLAHTWAAAGVDKSALRGAAPNIGIVTAYNDMLSAHQPFESYPQVIRAAARLVGATAQVAGGVPAMCDGITQGRDGMELSLMSRDVIALSTAVALSHEAFDGALLLGVCDKIVPGLFMGAASFGQLPIAFVPAGPMPSGVPNKAKAQVRQRFAAGQATREELLEVESASYHDAGTCTFYGTANSNQLLMEIMGMHAPGAAFVNPGLPLRHALTVAVTQRIAAATRSDERFADVIDERSFVNAIVGLMATGGSTNHTMHLIAMARACGIDITWDDMAELSAATPLLARIYPNGSADVNHFHAAGGMAFIVRELLSAGLLHGDVKTVWGANLDAYALDPYLDGDRLAWREPPQQSLDRDVLRSYGEPFREQGGLALLRGSLGDAIIKTSAVDPALWHIEAPARVFESQEALAESLKAGGIDGDFIAVVRGQGPRANGMPELHQLVPALAGLLAKGLRVGLVTDGRMSGASGTVPSAIHVTPESAADGNIGLVRDGDVILLDARHGILELRVDAETLEHRRSQRASSGLPVVHRATGLGRELFDPLRAAIGAADRGASFLFG